MPTVRVVEALDEVEDGKPGLGLGAKPPPIEQLALQGGEEALAERVVVTVADRTHRGQDSGLLAPQPERDRRVLRPLVLVVDDRQAGAGPVISEHRELKSSI